jgi:hypothetical protein
MTEENETLSKPTGSLQPNGHKIPMDLPKRLGKERIIPINYAICRFKNSKKAFRIEQDQKDTWLTVKFVMVQGKLQAQVHFRFAAKDKWFDDKEEIIDTDIYIDM